MRLYSFLSLLNLTRELRQYAGHVYFLWRSYIHVLLLLPDLAVLWVKTPVSLGPLGWIFFM